jgi:hypothetical protein
MKIYVINLKRRTDRLDKILADFQTFNFTNYEIVEAVDGSNETYESIAQYYDRNRAIEFQRDLTINEVCTAISHQLVYERILASEDSHAVIIEDDSPITQKLIDFCNSEPPPIDITLLGYYTSNENSPCPTHKQQSYKYKIMDICSDSRVYFTRKHIIGRYFEFDKQSREVDFLHGAHCYCVSKSGCQQIMAQNKPIIMEADNTRNYFPPMVLYGIRPMLVEIDRVRNESDLELERKVYQDTKPFNPSFVGRIRSAGFGT